MIAALVLLPLFLPQETEDHFFPIEVRATGPMEAFSLDHDGVGTEVQLSLRAGEELRLRVPVDGRIGLGLARGMGLTEVAELRGVPSEQVRLLGAEEPAGSLLPLELLRRPLPPQVAPAPELHSASLLLVLLGAVLVAGSRRRPRIAAGLAIAAAVGAAWTQAAHPPPEPGSSRVLEGLEDRWLLVEGARGRLPIDVDVELRVLTPRGADLSYEGTGDANGVRWTATTDDRPIWRLAPLDPGARRVSVDLNLWGAFAEVWSRPSGESWSSHGPWALGDPLGEGMPGAPPGWLAAGLPQGRTVLVGRLAREAWRGPEGPGDPETTWLRWIE